MNIRPTDNNKNDDWFNSFFDFGQSSLRRRNGRLGLGRLLDIDPFRAYEEMEDEMSRIFGKLSDIQTNAPKELVREYQTSDGAKVREVGPLVYGYSMTIGPDGKPKVREFGNVKSSGQGTLLNSAVKGSKPQITSEREPLVDVNSNDNEVKVVLEIPGVKKEDIKINAHDGAVEVTASNPQRKYHKTIDLPQDANTETAKSTYHNGVLEITFGKKENAKPKGKEIKIE
jgi:HSP20 family protein